MRWLCPILLFVFPMTTEAQNPWPTADAEWNYITYWGWPPPPFITSYTKYHVDGTEIIEGKSCTRLFADSFFNGNFTEGTTPTAYLHFDGDTLWHYVESTFYPLVCFNGIPGDSWHPLPFDSTFIDTACTVLPIEVLDTFSVNHNNQTYRGVHIGNLQNDGHLRWAGSFDERTIKNPDIGYNGTLFPFYNACDAVVDWYWNDLLCYSDSELNIINDNITGYNGETDCEYPWNLVGMDVPIEERISVYPNPATDNLRLESQTPLAQVKLKDLAGRVALQQSFRQAQGDVSINVGGLPSGIYLLEAISEHGRRTVQKVVVE